jgi:hypothetical protein
MIMKKILKTFAIVIGALLLMLTLSWVTGFILNFSVLSTIIIGVFSVTTVFLILAAMYIVLG